MSKSRNAKSKAKAPAKPKPKATAGRKPAPVLSKPVVVESPKTPAAPTHDQIAAKAHEIWVAKGRPVGQDNANWAEAEAALRG
ncbi:DUF2934 domain-containing protein [Phycisphaeraceae bacterium D3-23]